MDTISRSYDIIKAIRDEFNRVDSMARNLFPAYANTSVPSLSFFIKGRCAGRANFMEWTVKINSHMAAQNHDEMVDTVSHEIAHLVAFVVYGDRGHGAGWKRVHRMLGGSAKRTLNTQAAKVTVIPARRKTMHLYRSDCGVETWMGPRYHSNLQNGKYKSMRNKRHNIPIYPHHYTGQSRMV